MGHVLISPSGSLKLHPPPHSVIQTHIHRCKYSFFPLTVSQAVWQKALVAQLLAGVPMSQQSTPCTGCRTRWFPELFFMCIKFIRTVKITLVLLVIPVSFFPDYLCKQHFEKHTGTILSWQKCWSFFVFFIFCWFRNAFALNTSANFFW